MRSVSSSGVRVREREKRERNCCSSVVAQAGPLLLLLLLLLLLRRRRALFCCRRCCYFYKQGTRDIYSAGARTRSLLPSARGGVCAREESMRREGGKERDCRAGRERAARAYTRQQIWVTPRSIRRGGTRAAI